MDKSYILFETPNIVAIVTGLKAKSKNTKTGAMAHIWFLNRNYHPFEAVMNDADREICFSCPYRQQVREVKKNKVTFTRKCYVNVMKAPANIWKAYKRGNYKHFNGDYSIFHNKFIRFGAYGEPVLLPYDMVETIAANALGWTGYTHQWKNPLFQAYKKYFMASTDESDYQEAQVAGWRTFTIASKTLENQVVCPASAEAGHKTTCEDCGLCAGTLRRAKSIQIQPHGQQKKRFQIVA